MIGKPESRQATYPQATQKPHKGFSATGQFFTSEIPVENSTTRFAEWVVREIRDEFLSPRDVYFLALRENLPDAFRTDTLEQWQTLDRFWMWPTARSATSLEEFVRSLGGKHPWLSDEYLWTKLCDDAEAKYGHASRHVHPEERKVDIDALCARLPEMPRSSDPD